MLMVLQRILLLYLMDGMYEVKRVLHIKAENKL